MSETKRVADLEVGDLTQHAGGACSCGEPYAPWRVEKLDPFGPGIDVTWSHPACGRTSEPLPCGPDCRVAFYGRSA